MKTFIARTRMPVNPTNFVDLQPLIDEFHPIQCVCTNIELPTFGNFTALCSAAQREYDFGDIDNDPDIAAVNDIVYHFLDGCIATDMAVNYAMLHRVSANIGGGYHHATMDPTQAAYGCLINDAGFAALKHPSRKVGVLDFDFHRGGGLFRLGLNIDNLFPADWHFPSGRLTRDWDASFDPYEICNDPVVPVTKKNHAADTAWCLSKVLECAPDVIIYNAGADAISEPLTIDDLLERDKQIFTQLHNRNIPVAITLGGGYDDQAIVYWQKILRLADAIFK